MIDIGKLEKILPSVLKPARYTGGEYQEVSKEINDDTLRYAMCFPDVYEVGMSHMGSAILYHVVNSMAGVFAERCYCPWGDMEQAMRENDIPLYSLETKTQISEFDMIGLGSGIYDYELAGSILSLIEGIDSLSGKKVFVFSTVGVAVKSQHDSIKKLLKLQNASFVGDFYCKGFNTNSFLKYIGGMNKGRPNADDLERAQSFAENLIK